VKVAEFAEARTVTDAGTGSATLFEESATVLPLAEAATSRVTVHVVDAPDTRLAGPHTRDDTFGLIGATVTVAVVLAPSVAVTVTVCGAATDPAVAVNVVDVALAGTVTEAGTGSAALLDASATTPPPAGAF
jgi:tRNA A58 N-methylase Trm61